MSLHATACTVLHRRQSDRPKCLFEIPPRPHIFAATTFAKYQATRSQYMACCIDRIMPMRHSKPAVAGLTSLPRQPATAVEVADAGDQGGDGGALRHAEVGVPAVHEQHHASLVAAVPGLVLEGVVEGDAAAFLPLVDLPAHVQRATLRHDQR